MTSSDVERSGYAAALYLMMMRDQLANKIGIGFWATAVAAALLISRPLMGAADVLPALYHESEDHPPSVMPSANPSVSIRNQHWVRAAQSDCWAYFQDGLPNNSFDWSGDCRDRMISGAGKFVWKSFLAPTAVLEGTFSQGHLNGTGTKTLSSGEVEQGQLLDGKLSGRGVERWPNGSFSEGTFKDDLLDGQGHLHKQNIDDRVGSFKQGQMEGPGTLTFASGAVLVGTFHGDLDASDATLRLPNGTTYSGTIALPRWVSRFPTSVPYPPNALRMAEQGSVTLGVHVGASGQVSNVRVLESSGHSDLDDAAAASASATPRLPATVNGKPIEFDDYVSFNFRIRQRYPH